MERCVQSVQFCSDLCSHTPHRHNICQMIYVARGKIRAAVAACTYDVRAPSVIFISSLEPHSVRVLSPKYERYTLLVDPAAAHDRIKDPMLLSVFSNRPEGFRHVIDVSPVRDRVSFLVRMLLDGMGDGGAAFPEEEALLLHLLLIELCRVAPEGMFTTYTGVSSTVWEIKQELERNVRREVRLGALAKKYHLSACYLAHCFKRITGYSVKQYQLFCRISMARELLANSGMGIAQVALQSGFPDTSDFSRYFRRVMGCTPSGYRREAQARPGGGSA